MPELTPAMAAYIYTLTAVLGLCMGSFLNCFAYRYSKHESVMKGRSKCALCGHSLSAPDLVPVFSWLFLRGKCRYCGERVSPRYVLAEIICALAFVSVVWRFGFAAAGEHCSPLQGVLQYLILVSLLFAAAFSDIHGGLIPDRLIIIGTVSAFLFALFRKEGAAEAAGVFPPSGFPLSTLINGLSVALPLLLIVLAFDKLMKKDTMGGGDIKLMFLIGLYFDWRLNILILILACIIGIAFALIKRPTGEKHGQQGAFSFAPALAIAAWCVMLWGDGVMDWYLGLF